MAPAATTLCERLKKVKPSNANSIKTPPFKRPNIKPHRQVTVGKKACFDAGFNGRTARKVKTPAANDMKVAAIVKDNSPLQLDTAMSPEKAARVTMLRGRYAETILKAQKLCTGNNGGILVEECMKKIEEAKKKTMEDEKKKRKELRKAARDALEKMERTVHFDDGLMAEKEFALLVNGAPLSYCIF